MTDLHGYLTLKINLIKDPKHLSPKAKDALLKFLLAFNVFEDEFFQEPKWEEKENAATNTSKSVKARIKEIQTICNENDYPLELLKDFQEHFSEIYIENNVRTQRFNSLEKSQNYENGFETWEMDFLYDFLNEPLNKNKEHGILNALKLSYKFRNNLFHGTKCIEELEKYTDDFEVINNFIIELMRYLDEINASKF